MRKRGAMRDLPDGLDLDVLRAHRPIGHDLGALLSRIEQHLDDADGYLAFSGGKDSLVALHLARQVDSNIPVVFFDSGAEYPETYTYISDLADRWGLNLSVYPSDPPLLQYLAQSGAWDLTAPNTASEHPLHDVLITQPANRAHSDQGPGEIWGVRADESVKGSGRWSLYHRALAEQVDRNCRGCCTTRQQQRDRHGGKVERADGTVAFGPIWNWSRDDVWAYIARTRLPMNPVYTILRDLGVPEQQHRVSHIIDASFLERGRVTWLKRGWPSLFEELTTVLPRLYEFS